MRKPEISCLGLIFLAIIFLVASNISEAAIEYRVTDLGFLPEDTTPSAQAISGNGNIVVGDTNYEAFRWTANEGMVGLGHLPSSYSQSKADDISSNGEVIVGRSGTEAFRWTADEGMVGLGYFTDGKPFLNRKSEANGVSGDGTVIVGTHQIENASGYEQKAFRWTASEGMVALDGYGSGASDVSADGSVIVGGGYNPANSGYEGYRWTASEGMVGLGDLPGGSFYSYATSISDDGSTIVGYSKMSYYSYEWEAFRWTASEGMVGLGDLPGGDFYSYASGVSADGSIIVGSSESANTTGGAFRWTLDGGMENLNDLIDPASGWLLSQASDVSGYSGHIICYGANINDGSLPRYVLLTPIPEPASVFLLGSGLLGLVGFNRKKKKG